jgi:hypothetical protein
MKIKTVLLIAALVGLVFLLIPLGSIIKTVNLKKHGILVEGTVQKVSSQGKGLRVVTVSFYTTEGQLITAKASKRQYVSTGDVVTIWYNPATPEKIDFGDTIGYNMRGVIIGGFIFIICFVLFIRAAIKDSANKKLLQTGMKIAVEYSVVRNEKYRMGDRNPWVIRGRWVDDRNNQEYFFASKDYTIDPTPYLAGKDFVEVYIDPADPGKYFMDTSLMPKGNITIG